MLVAFILLVLCVSCVQNDGGFSVSCGEGNETPVTVAPSADGEAARYVVRYCAAARGVTNWDLTLRFLDEPPERCDRATLGKKLRLNRLHSISTEDVASLHLNCSHTCFSKTMDLMFRRCYHLSNKFQRGNIHSQPYESYYYADNNISGPEHFYNSSRPPNFKDFRENTKVSFNWYPGHVPIMDYEMEMCKDNVTCEEERECRDVKANCSRPADAPRHLNCDLDLPHGCYVLRLTHAAPWVSSKDFQDLQHVTAHFCHSAEQPLPAAQGPLPAAVYWAGLAGAAAALTALAALLAWHSRLLRKLPRLQQRVLDYWLSSRQGGVGVEAKQGACGDDTRVLLLYARDCAPAQRAVAALLELLQLTAPGRVYDIFSSETTALAGGAPHAWVRGALADPRVRVVLLQTPALHALHATRLAAPATPTTPTDPTEPAAPDDLRLEEPLLPRCVVYRAPQFGDTLLQYALRLMADSDAAAAAPYHKYYIATLSELPAETFPTVVPFRRYELPGAAGVLLRDLLPAPAPPPPPAEPLAELHDAARELVQYVRDNPNYLTDELLFL